MQEDEERQARVCFREHERRSFPSGSFLCGTSTGPTSLEPRRENCADRLARMACNSIKPRPNVRRNYASFFFLSFDGFGRAFRSRSLEIPQSRNIAGISPLILTIREHNIDLPEFEIRL
jgi:hypothetical protein